MKIFEKYNFAVSGSVISKNEFCRLPFMRKENFNKDKLVKVIEKANLDLGKDIPPLTLSQYRAYHTVGSTSAYGSPYRERMNMAIRLCFAEICTGEGKYVDKLVDVIWAMLDESTWMLPEHTVHMPEEATVGMRVPRVAGERYSHGLELGSAYRSALIALIYHLLGDEFDKISPFIGERIVYTLKKRTIEPFCNYYFRWEGVDGNKVNNWCPWIVSNVLFTTAVIEDDTSVREAVVNRSMTFLDNFINCYKPDGGCEEGPTYWNAAAACLFDSLELLEYLTAGKINICSEPLIKAMGEYIARMNITGVYFVNFADSHARASQDGDMLRRFGEKCGSEILKSYSYSMLKYNDTPTDVALPYRTLRSYTSPTVDTNGRKLTAATDTYFADLKVMLLRDSEDPDNGVFLAMKGGHNDESHNHNDVGSFIVYKNGKPVLIDAGVGEYTKKTFSSERYTIWSMQSLYHNLPSFDGIGQRNGKRYASKNEIYDEGERRLTLEISDAYPEECGVISYVRSGTLKDGAVTVEESVRLNKESLIDFIFVTHREPIISTGGSILLAEGMELCYDNCLEAKVERFDPEGMNTMHSFGTDVLYRIHLSVKSDRCEVSFIIR